MRFGLYKLYFSMATKYIIISYSRYNQLYPSSHLLFLHYCKSYFNTASLNPIIYNGVHLALIFKNEYVTFIVKNLQWDICI